MGGRIAQQAPSQFNPCTFHHTHALFGEGPNNACAIRNHELSRLNRSTKLLIIPGCHRHLRIERDNASASIGMET